MRFLDCLQHTIYVADSNNILRSDITIMFDEAKNVIVITINNNNNNASSDSLVGKLKETFANIQTDWANNILIENVKNKTITITLNIENTTNNNNNTKNILETLETLRFSAKIKPVLPEKTARENLDNPTPFYGLTQLTETIEGVDSVLETDVFKIYGINNPLLHDDALGKALYYSNGIYNFDSLNKKFHIIINGVTKTTKILGHNSTPTFFIETPTLNLNKTTKKELETIKSKAKKILAKFIEKQFTENICKMTFKEILFYLYLNKNLKYVNKNVYNHIYNHAKQYLDETTINQFFETLDNSKCVHNSLSHLQFMNGTNLTDQDTTKNAKTVIIYNKNSSNKQVEKDNIEWYLFKEQAKHEIAETIKQNSRYKTFFFLGLFNKNEHEIFDSTIKKCDMTDHKLYEQAKTGEKQLNYHLPKPVTINLPKQQQ